jgi:hypothetical protein
METINWDKHSIKYAIEDKKIAKRLKELKRAIIKENISYSEIAELQSLSKYIDKSDVLLLEWAGVKE